MARKPPHFTVWVDDAEAHLFRSQESLETSGARFRLWLRARRASGYLPNDSETLRKWAGATSQQWKKIWPELIDSWTIEGQRLVVERLREESDYQDRASAAGKVGAEARHSRIATESQSDRTTTAKESHRNRIANFLPSSSSPSPLRSSSDPSRSLPQSGERAREPDPRDFSAGYSADFSRFRAAYPRWKGTGMAWRIWQTEAPPIDDVLAALEWQRASPAWAEELGRFIPDPANWLRARSWEDDPSGYQARDANGVPPPIVKREPWRDPVMEEIEEQRRRDGGDSA